MAVLERLNLRHLVLFRTLAETSNFTEAARRCGISQPGLSAAIKQLESELGVPLFQRDTRNVVLTEAGEAILPLVRATVANGERAVEDIRLAALMGKSPVRVAAVSSISSYLLPSVLGAFEAASGGVPVEILDVPSGQEILVEGRADIGIGVGPLDTEKFDVDYLFGDPLSLVVREDHPLAKREAVLWPEIAAEPIAVYQPDTESFRTVRNTFAVHGIHFAPRATFYYRQSIFGMALAGAAVSILPGLSLERTMPPGLVRIPLTDPVVNRQYFVFTMKGRALTADVEETRRHLKHLLGEAWRAARGGPARSTDR